MNKNFILPKIIGHRGVKDLKPENTIESVQKAFELGLECVEIDVKISKDNIPILIHDDTLDRTTTGSGLVCDYTYDELRNFDAGYFFYKSNTNLKIPKLINVLKLVKDKKKYINLELKPNKGLENLNVKKIIKEIKIISYDKIYFSSFDLQSCIDIKELLPDSLCGFLNDDFGQINLDDTIKICKKFNFFSCGVNYKYLSNFIINEFIKNNILVTVYADKNISLSEAKKLWSNKIASIFVDDPSDYFNDI